MLFIHCVLTRQFDVQYLLTLNIKQWILFVLFSGLGFANIQVINFYAIKRIGVYITSIFLSFNPVVTYIGSLIFMNEQTNVQYNVGIVLLLCSLLITMFTQFRLNKVK